MNAKRHPRSSPRDEKGMVLVLGLLLVSVLALVGTTAVMTSTTDMKINSNYKSGAQAFYIAEAGIERALAKLRQMDPVTNSDLSNALNNCRGNNNVLSNSTNIANFFANGAFVTDDVPYIASTSFGGGTYRVYLTNDAKDGVTSQTDANLKVTLTSFGQGQNNSLAVVQVVVGSLVPSLSGAGAIVLPGPDVSFSGGHDHDSKYDGHALPAVALTSATALNTVNNYISGHPGDSRYDCDHSPCTKNVAATIDPTLNSVGGIEGLYRTLVSVANTVTGSPGSTTTLTNAELGNSTNRKIVVVNGNAVIDNVFWQDGAGILVVTGQLTLRNNADYKGLILCIGQGSVVADGWYDGDFKGTLLVAKTRDASNNLLSALGNPTYNLYNDYHTDFDYSASNVGSSMPAAARRLVRQSWKQLF